MLKKGDLKLLCHLTILKARGDGGIHAWRGNLHHKNQVAGRLLKVQSTADSQSLPQDHSRY